MPTTSPLIIERPVMTQDGIEMLAAKNYNNDNENRILNSDTSQSNLNVGSLLFLPLNRIDC